VSAAADEAGARLAAKARQRELEQALVTARAGGRVDVAPPTREEAVKLASKVESGSSASSFARAAGLIGAGIAALAMISIGGFGWLGFVVPILFIVIGGQLGDRFADADRSRKAGRIQLELARASLTGEAARAAAEVPVAAAVGRTAETVVASAPVRPTLVETGDPRTRAEVVATLDRLATRVRGLVPDDDLATIRRIRDSAALALPATDAPLDLTDHETWLVRQICIDYLPRALEHYIALPADLASEPVLEGRSARQVLDEQLALIEARLHEMAAREYRREAGGLLNHARFVADSLRPDPFQQRLAELAAAEAATAELEAATTELEVARTQLEVARAAEAAALAETATAHERERA
jgi:hypothetical protein